MSWPRRASSWARIPSGISMSTSFRERIQSRAKHRCWPAAIVTSKRRTKHRERAAILKRQARRDRRVAGERAVESWPDFLQCSRLWQGAASVLDAAKAAHVTLERLEAW